MASIDRKGGGLIMWRVVIADDEPKIRKGLKNFVKWSEYDMEVVGEAEDGEIAHELAVKLKPDIMLVDINMPFLNGLDLIEKLKESLPSCIIIIVTGHDEFAYAQKALKLKVFDYLLKPVRKEQMCSALEAVRSELLNRESKNNYVDWAERQLKKSLPYLKESFLKDWVMGNLSDGEIRENLDFYGIHLSDSSGMIVIKVVDKPHKEELIKEQDRLLCVQNLVEKFTEKLEPNIIFKDSKGNIIIIVPIIEQSHWVTLGEKIQQECDKNLDLPIILSQEIIKNGIKDIPKIYQKLIEDIQTSERYTPVVLQAKKYIDNFYYKDDISLQEVAREMQVSPTYLSRLLKQEIGVSFVEYLTQVRLRKAIQLLNDPTLKIYEIAERVGYKSQHYFCTAFKKVLDVPPAEYRKGGVKN